MVNHFGSDEPYETYDVSVLPLEFKIRLTYTFSEVRGFEIVKTMREVFSDLDPVGDLTPQDVIDLRAHFRRRFSPKTLDRLGVITNISAEAEKKKAPRQRRAASSALFRAARGEAEKKST